MNSASGHHEENYKAVFEDSEISKTGLRDEDTRWHRPRRSRIVPHQRWSFFISSKHTRATSRFLSLSLSSGGLCKNTLSEVEAGFQKKLAVKLKSALRTAAEQITSSPSARVSMQTTSKLNRIVSRIAQKFRERLV